MKKIILLTLFCCSGPILWSQMTFAVPSLNYQQLKEKLVIIPKNTNFTDQVQHFTLLENKKNGFILTNEQQQVPLAYAYKDLAFFCKIEVQLEKAVKLPVKFRLGSVDYVDYLEGKRDGY